MVIGASEGTEVKAIADGRVILADWLQAVSYTHLAYSEYTLRRNVEDLSEVALRQRILKNMSDLSLSLIHI